MGVSGQRGNSTASVLENSIYTDKIIHHIGFVEFIKESIGISFVDFLFLDAEGAEYQIMPLLSAGGPVDSAGISICQIAAEMHGPVINYGINMSQWDEIIRNFLFKSDFLPLWSDTIMGHYRTYFINYRNPICVRKFFSNLCSGES